MPADEDKYPEESGRRRFIKGVVGSATLGAVAAGTGASLNAATSAPGGGGGPVEFVGIEIVAGPAPRGMPLIPVQVKSDGTIAGKWPDVETEMVQGREIKVAEMEIGGMTYSSTWFQYCGVQSYKAAQPGVDANNNFLIKPGKYDWMSDLTAGEPLNVDMFENYRQWGNGIGKSGLGKPAMADWRNTEDGRPMPVQVLRTPELPKMINGEGKYSQIPADVRKFVDAATEENVMAWMDKCTHFCCVPGFKTSSYASAEDMVYCQCHQSRYDPFSPLKYRFVALPRPD